MADKAKPLTRESVAHGAKDGRWSPATHLEILATLDAQDGLLARLAVVTEALDRLVAVISMQLARGEEGPAGSFEAAWKQACEAKDATPDALTTWLAERDAAAFARGVEAAIVKARVAQAEMGVPVRERDYLLAALRSLIPSTNKEG